MNLGMSLEVARVKAGVTKLKMSDDLGVTRQTVGEWAKFGRMNTETLRALAYYFDMKVSEFVALGE